jgi:hypothetical protein
MNDLSFKLLDLSKSSLTLNSNEQHYDLLSKQFQFYNIPYNTTDEKNNIGIEFITEDKQITNIFLLSHILFNYDVVEILFVKTNNEKIKTSFCFNIVEAEKDIFILPEGYSTETILRLDPKMDTETFSKLFNLQSEFDENDYFEDELESKNAENESQFYETNNYDEDTFYALTDGQLGDFDDFNGSMDDLETWSRG